MVAHSSYGQCFHAIRTGDAAHVSPEFRLHLVGYQRPSFVRGKHIMDQDAGVGHGSAIVQSQPSLRDSCRGGIFTRHSATLRAGLTCSRACGTLLSNLCSVPYRAMPVDQVPFPENIHRRATGDFA